MSESKNKAAQQRRLGLRRVRDAAARAWLIVALLLAVCTPLLIYGYLEPRFPISTFGMLNAILREHYRAFVIAEAGLWVALFLVSRSYHSAVRRLGPVEKEHVAKSMLKRLDKIDHAKDAAKADRARAAQTRANRAEGRRSKSGKVRE